LILRTYHPASHFENLFLLAGHIFCGSFRSVAPTGEVQQAVDNAQSGFLAWAVAKSGRILTHDASPNEDFAIWEGDDIGGLGVIEVLPVHLRDRRIPDNGRFNLLKRV
jgi:hypothetical protein